VGDVAAIDRAGLDGVSVARHCPDDGVADVNCPRRRLELEIDRRDRDACRCDASSFEDRERDNAERDERARPGAMGHVSSRQSVSAVDTPIRTSLDVENRSERGERILSDTPGSPPMRYARIAIEGGNPCEYVWL
jgi:hypothetical protein